MRDKYAIIPNTDMIVFATVLDTSKKIESKKKSSAFADIVQVNCDLTMPDYIHDAIMYVANEAVSVGKYKSEVEKQRKLASIKNSIIGIVFKVSFYATVINWDEICPAERMKVLTDIVKEGVPSFDFIEVKDPEQIKQILDEVLGELKKRFEAEKGRK